MTHTKGSSGLAAAFLVLSVTGTGLAQEPKEDAFPLGQVHFAISCTDEAQQAFNRAVALLHHMTYPQAKAAFERVAAHDPACAMAFWGVAMTLFQPLWPTRPGPDELQQGWASVQRAKALAPPTEREQLYIATAEAFFREPRAGDYWERIRRWEQATEAVYRRFPDDPDAAAFYALAHLATAPADGKSLNHQDRAAEILLSIHAVNPLHPGTIHYLIHANDVRGREQESLDIIRSYANIAPHNPHALHMPTHIYTRLGNWEEVIKGNLRAAQAALEHPAGEESQYVWDVRLAVSAWIAHEQGQGERALEQMEAAAELEVATPKHPVTPAPTLPADELLGDLLMEQGKADKALAAFQRALALHPQRFNSLLGAARAARALEEEQAARRFYAALLEMSGSASTRVGLREARAYLGEGTHRRE